MPIKVIGYLEVPVTNCAPLQNYRNFTKKCPEILVRIFLSSRISRTSGNPSSRTSGKPENLTRKLREFCNSSDTYFDITVNDMDLSFLSSQVALQPSIKNKRISPPQKWDKAITGNGTQMVTGTWRIYITVVCFGPVMQQFMLHTKKAVVWSNLSLHWLKSRERAAFKAGTAVRGKGEYDKWRQKKIHDEKASESQRTKPREE